LSFELSFLALFGILTIGNRVARYVSTYVPPFICLPISCSVGAQIATAALIIYHFGVIYPIGMVSSLILAPLVTVFMWSGIVCFILPISAIVQWAGIWLDGIYRVIVLVAGTFSGFSGIAIGPGERGIGAVVEAGIFICLLLLLIFLERKGRHGIQ
jgi:competence protein ComEC